MTRTRSSGGAPSKTPLLQKDAYTTSACASPDSNCPALTERMFVTEPGVVCAMAMSPGTPHLPPTSQGSAPGGCEMTEASVLPTEKYVPEVGPVAMRKNETLSVFLSSWLPKYTMNAREKSPARQMHPTKTRLLLNRIALRMRSWRTIRKVGSFIFGFALFEVLRNARGILAQCYARGKAFEGDLC